MDPGAHLNFVENFTQFMGLVFFASQLARPPTGASPHPGHRRRFEAPDFARDRVLHYAVRTCGDAHVRAHVRKSTQADT